MNSPKCTEYGFINFLIATPSSYSCSMELITHHWSGKHKQVVPGINLITLMWTDGDSHIPSDYRLYNKQHDGLSKNDHFQALIATADDRGVQPECVVFDG